MDNRQRILQQIQEVHNNKETGILALIKKESSINIHFHQGSISAISTNMSEHKLGQYLIKAGFLDSSALSNLLRECQGRRIPLGELAISKKLLGEAELMDVVQEQVFQTLSLALRNDFELDSFTKNSSSVPHPVQIDLEVLMLGLARKNIRSLDVEPTKQIMLKNGTNLGHLPWYPQELSVLHKLKYPRTILELAAATGLDYSRLFKILSVFNTLQLLSFVEQPLSDVTAVIKRKSFAYDTLIPEIPATSLSDKLELSRDESSFVSEQFKTLKVRISEISSKRALRVITVSSPSMEEGKSLISINLALCFSKDAGRRTFLLDCDLRNPTLHKYLGIAPEPGLMEFLEDEGLQPYCYMRRHEKLYFMTSGGIAANPIELLSLEKMQNLIESLRKEFDTVIVDSPPLSPISDGNILASLSDGLVLVVRSGRTSYANLEKAFKTMDPGKLLGVVLNDVKPMMFNTRYNYKYYHYRYRNHYPYGQKPSRPRSKTYLDN